MRHHHSGVRAAALAHPLHQSRRSAVHEPRHRPALAFGQRRRTLTQRLGASVARAHQYALSRRHVRSCRIRAGYVRPTRSSLSGRLFVQWSLFHRPLIARSTTQHRTLGAVGTFPRCRPFRRAKPTVRGENQIARLSLSPRAVGLLARIEHTRGRPDQQLRMAPGEPHPIAADLCRCADAFRAESR